MTRPIAHHREAGLSVCNGGVWLERIDARDQAKITPRFRHQHAGTREHRTPETNNPNKAIGYRRDDEPPMVQPPHPDRYSHHRRACGQDAAPAEINQAALRIEVFRAQENDQSEVPGWDR